MFGEIQDDVLFRKINIPSRYMIISKNDFALCISWRRQIWRIHDPIEHTQSNSETPHINTLCSRLKGKTFTGNPHNSACGIK